ncbi:MAG TPA: LamG domain-containing protein, partial [Polyangiaceae bacterium]|nr:LamG domain-containing protein [Polyangiaceae bacterium]
MKRSTRPFARVLPLLLSACQKSPTADRKHVEPTGADATSAGAGHGAERVSAASASAAPPVPFEPRALALAWNGSATLPFDAQRLGADHTIFARFMPAYEGAYRGILIADQTGSYRLGMAPYASLNQPAMEVVIGGSTFTTPLPQPLLSTLDVTRRAEPPLTARWLSLAVSVRGTQATVYVNGASAGTLDVGERHLAGPLVLGRLARAEAVQDQFYGLVDDVAIFERALAPAEVLALNRLPRFDSRLDALLAVADFDRTRASSRSLEPTLSGAATLSAVSGRREPRPDAARLPSPQLPVRFSLPFAPGQTWMVIQGANSVGSHHDTAAFAIDFQRVDPLVVEHNPEHRPGASAALSAGQSFLAAAEGRVVSLVDCFRENDRGCSGVHVDP